MQALSIRRPGGWLAVATITVGLFAIVTVEILPIGLLTPIAQTFGVTNGTAGLLMTAPGLLAAAAAPMVTIAARRIDRRSMLIGLIGLLTVANLIAATAPSFGIAAAARVLVGITIGAYWSITAGIGARLVGPERAALATTIIFSAVPLGSVLGVPLGTLLGNSAGWRFPFVMSAALASLILVAAFIWLPNLRPTRAVRIKDLTALLRRPQVRTGLAATVVLVLAHFGTYTYVRPFLQDRTRLSPTTIAVLLLVYGAAGVVGNALAGRFAGRRPEWTLGVAACGIAVSLLVATWFASSPLIVAVMLVVWGASYGAVPAATSAWFGKAIPDQPEAAAIFFTSSFQATLSIGALLGGVLLDNSTIAVVFVTCAILAAAVTFGAWVAGKRDSGPSLADRRSRADQFRRAMHRCRRPAVPGDPFSR